MFYFVNICGARRIIVGVIAARIFGGLVSYIPLVVAAFVQPNGMKWGSDRSLRS